jgi:hypothetical protein
LAIECSTFRPRGDLGQIDPENRRLVEMDDFRDE